MFTAVRGYLQNNALYKALLTTAQNRLRRASKTKHGTKSNKISFYHVREHTLVYRIKGFL